MAIGELIFSSDYLNTGRMKINNWYSGTSAIWSSSTGTYSVIRNNADENLGNAAMGVHSIAAGLTNRAAANYSMAFWGKNNTASTLFASVITGKYNVAGSVSSSILAGSGNTIYGASPYALILNGWRNTVSSSSKYATIINGKNSLASGNYSLVHGFFNTAWTHNNIVLGGRYNSASGNTILYSNYRADNAIIGGGGAAIDGTNPGKNIIKGGAKSIILGGIGGKIYDSQSCFISSSGLYGQAIYGSSKSLATISGGSNNSSIISSIDATINSGARSSIIGSNSSHIKSTNTGAIILGSSGSIVGTSGAANRSSIISSANSDLPGFTPYSTIIAATTCVLSGLTSNSSQNAMIATSSSTMKVATTAGQMIRSAIIGGHQNQISVTGSASSNIVIGGYTNIISKYANGANFSSNSIIGGNTNKIFNRAGAAYVTKNNFIAGGESNTVHTTGSTRLSYNSSIIGGKRNRIVSKNSVVAGGSGNTIVADYSFIGGGKSNTIDIPGIYGGATYSTIIGGIYNRIMPGPYGTNNSAIIGGRSNLVHGGASSSCSVVIGGRNNMTYYNYTVAMGGGSRPRGQLQLVIGNQPFLSPASANNRIRLDAVAGQGVASVSFITGTADYAEYFEWLDKNKNNEDRKGFFVSLLDDKIEIGNSNIIGIVSSAPGFIGDAAELAWNDMYIKDEWNRETLVKYKTYTWIDESGTENKVFEDDNKRKMLQFPNPGYPKGLDFTETIPVNAKIGEFTAPKMNPDYDPNSKYIPRSERKEWAPVGLLGKLHVRTAEPITGKSIDVNAQGMAINGTKYNVLNVVREHTQSQYGIVRIFFK